MASKEQILKYPAYKFKLNRIEPIDFTNLTMYATYEKHPLPYLLEVYECTEDSGIEWLGKHRLCPLPTEWGRMTGIYLPPKGVSLMNTYAFEIRNSGNDEQFIIEANDLIDAHMKASDFIKVVDEKIKDKFNIDETSKVSMVSEFSFKWANDAGISEYLAENKDYFEAKVEE